MGGLVRWIIENNKIWRSNYRQFYSAADAIIGCSHTSMKTIFNFFHFKISKKNSVPEPGLGKQTVF